MVVKGAHAHNSAIVAQVADPTISSQVSPATTKCQLVQYDDCPVCVFFGGNVDSIIVLDIFHAVIGSRIEYGIEAFEQIVDEVTDDSSENKVLIVASTVPVVLVVAGRLVESASILLPTTAPTPTQ